MEQLENVAGVLGGFGLAVWEIAKNHDRFLVAKSRPPPPSHRVVIKMWSGKWAPIFSSSRSRTGIEELLHVFRPPPCGGVVITCSSLIWSRRSGC